MGANVANEMASDAFCETTIGYKVPENGEQFKLAFDCPALKVGTVNDTVGVELCGALKNIVAIGAGFCDGLGYGGNTKAPLTLALAVASRRTRPHRAPPSHRRRRRPPSSESA